METLQTAQDIADTQMQLLYPKDKMLSLLVSDWKLWNHRQSQRVYIFCRLDDPAEYATRYRSVAIGVCVGYLDERVGEIGWGDIVPETVYFV